MESVEPLEMAAEYPVAGTAVLRPTGHLNLLTAPALQRRLLAEVLGGRRLLVVDLAATASVDSSGLAALLHGQSAARGAGGELRLARPNAQARTALELTALDRVLPVYDTVEQALAGG